LNPKCVLYAEDEFTNRKLLEIRLHNNGINCDLANDGLEAFDRFQKKKYDLIILDQYMPGLNGDQVARKIRKISKDIPLIAITSDDDEIANLRDAGFNEVFIKPLRGQKYMEIIFKYIGKE